MARNRRFASLEASDIDDKVSRWGTVAEIYVDTSPVSMFNRDHTGLSLLLADMRIERFDAILVTEIWVHFSYAEVGTNLSELIAESRKAAMQTKGAAR